MVPSIEREVEELESDFEYSEKCLGSPEVGSEGRERTGSGEYLPNLRADIHCLP